MVVFTDLITVEPVYNGYPRCLRNWLLNTGSQKILTSTLIYCGSLKSDVTDAKRPIISLQQLCKCDLFLWWQHFKYKKITHKMTRGLVSIQGWSLHTGKITKKDNIGLLQGGRGRGRRLIQVRQVTNAAWSVLWRLAASDNAGHLIQGRYIQVRLYFKVERVAISAGIGFFPGLNKVITKTLESRGNLWKFCP